MCLRAHDVLHMRTLIMSEHFDYLFTPPYLYPAVSLGGGGNGGTCSSDEECPGGEICDNGSCQTDTGGGGGNGGTCSSDEECPGGEICWYGSCQPDTGGARLLAYCANLLQSRPFPQRDCDSGHRRLMTFAAKFFLYAKVFVAVVMLAVIVSSEGVTRVQLRARSGTVAGMVMHCLVPCLETPDTCRQSVCVCVFVVGG